MKLLACGNDKQQAINCYCGTSPSITIALIIKGWKCGFV